MKVNAEKIVREKQMHDELSSNSTIAQTVFPKNIKYETGTDWPWLGGLDVVRAKTTQWIQDTPMTMFPSVCIGRCMLNWG